MAPNEQLFKELIYRHRDLIWSVCSNYRFSAAWETEDLFHEVLCTLWRDFGSFDGRSSERTWVWRVANNTIVSLKRRYANQPAPAPPPVAEPASQPDDSPALLQLVDSLGEPDSQIVRASMYGFGYAEIARMTGLTVAAVSMRLSRARRKIKKIYEKQ